MTTSSPRTRTTAIVIAAGLLLLGGCDNTDETAEQPPAPMQAPAAPEMEPSSSPPPAQQKPEMAPPADTMQAPSGTPDQSGMAQAPAAGGGDIETAMRNAGCFACHEVEQKKLGPAYAWVAYRYKDDANAVETLTKSIKNGTSGKWTTYTGGVPMPPNVQLSDEQIHSMVQWVLAREPQEPPAK